MLAFHWNVWQNLLIAQQTQEFPFSYGYDWKTSNDRNRQINITFIVMRITKLPIKLAKLCCDVTVIKKYNLSYELSKRKGGTLLYLPLSLVTKLIVRTKINTVIFLS